MSTETIEKARKMGWVPKEEWRGDPDQWREADEFVERGENIIPILRDQITKLKSDFDAATAMNQAEIARIKKEAYDKARADYEAELEALEEAEVEAFSKQDAAEYQRIRREKKNLRQPQPPQETPGPDPVFSSWLERNAWYLSDAELKEYADFIGSKLFANDQTTPAAQIFQKVAEKVKATFPHKFKNPNREKDGGVESSGDGVATGGKKDWNSLPASAKKQYERLEKQFSAKGRKITKEDFVKYYHEQS